MLLRLLRLLLLILTPVLIGFADPMPARSSSDCKWYHCFTLFIVTRETTGYRKLFMSLCARLFTLDFLEHIRSISRCIRSPATVTIVSSRPSIGRG
jgi:hypothetical protein